MTEQLIKQFDSLSPEYDGLIDECFYEWAKVNEAPYWSEAVRSSAPGDSDYPNEFKINFMENN